MGSMTTGIPTNPSFILDANMYATEDVHEVYGSGYFGGSAIRTSVNGTSMMITPNLPPGVLVGLYDVRIFYTTTATANTEVLALNIYRDDELLYPYNSMTFTHDGNSYPGFKLTDYFERGSAYSFEVVALNLNNYYEVVLDMIQFVAKPNSVLMDIDINADTNGDYIPFRQGGLGTVTGTGAVSCTDFIAYDIPFVEVTHRILCMVRSGSGLYNVTAINEDEYGFEATVARVDGNVIANGTGVGVFWEATGFVEPPIWA